MAAKKQFISIDLKSFYASVECRERGLDPMDTNLVVADESRTDKTICLAVSPPLKSVGVPGRARLFEAKQIIRDINARRLKMAPGRAFSGRSSRMSEIKRDRSLELGMIVAPPRMAHYMDYSRRVVGVYLGHVSIDDILIYSVDEVFIDVTHYLEARRMSARQFASMLIGEVMEKTGIPAAAGIGTNMYLAKVAMDIVAKHIPADENGVRIAELDERSYREKLWCHRPLTDFWRVGRGIARKLEQNGLFTMGDIARCSEGGDREHFNESLLYKLFGVNAELLIDHAWGWEPTEIADCKAYRPASRSLCSGQVLTRPYTAAEGRLVVSEMADSLSFDLVRQGLYTDRVSLEVGYDTENAGFRGEAVTDRYGRRMPKPAHGFCDLGRFTSSSKRIIAAAREIYDRVVDKSLTVRRFYLSVGRLEPEDEALNSGSGQLDLFTDYEAQERARLKEERELERERSMQKAMLAIRERYGKNSVVRGMDMLPSATAMERARQIGGHRA